MNDNSFAWDRKKASTNFTKHRVSFDEGATIFNDPFVITITDPTHSNTEQRYVSLGLSFKGRLLVVIHTERNNQIRLISCRKATPRERKTYENADK